MFKYIGNCLFFLFFALAAGGWVVNIIKLMGGGETDGKMLARAAGIFIAPLGAFLGYV